MKIEICLDNLASVFAAKAGGADRIEHKAETRECSAGARGSGCSLSIVSEEVTLS